MFNNMALKHKMILSGIAAVLIPFCIAGIIIYTQFSRSLLDVAKERSVNRSRDLSGLIEATLMQEIRLASSIAADPDIIAASKTGDYREAQKELEAIYERIGGDLFTIFLLDRKGIARADAHFNKEMGVNFSDREYFLKTKKGKTNIAGPLFSKGLSKPGEPIILICVPIQQNNEFYGMVGIPFHTDFLVNIILQKKSGRTGYAYLVNQEGLVLAHPKKEFILRFHFFDQAGVDNLAKIIKNRKTGSASYIVNGLEKIAGLTHMELTGWTVIFAQNRDEIMAPLNKVLIAMFFSGVLFLVGTVFIIIFVSSKISTPIQKMMEMVKQLTQHSNEIIVQTGADKKIIFVNPAFEKLTGQLSEKIIGTELNLNNAVHAAPDSIWESLEAGKPWSGRIILNNVNNDETTLDMVLVPIIDSNNSVAGYLAIGRDVTAELMFEKRLQEGQKLEAIGTLAGGIAHDFNNILTGIFGYAELLLMNNELNQKNEKYIREIIQASERARDLVSQILTFSRQANVELKPLLPGSVLKEALKLLRASIPATINIESKIDSNAVIMAEPTQIHQVIMNLFTNAAHAIGENTGTIKLELEDFFVDEEFIGAHPGINKGKHVILRISDTGCGINPESLDRIFDPFFTTKSPGKGTGLGLSVVHGIIKNLGGIITAYSEVGKGTVFNIIIPASEHDSFGTAPGAPSIKKGTERIAFIDDEIAIAETMQSILANLGYQVTVFTDGIDALETIKAKPGSFDIIITDYSMPRITGLEIAKSLKETGVYIPVILTSGYLSNDIESAARNAGISELTAKPINACQLTEAISRALQKG